MDGLSVGQIPAGVTTVKVTDSDGAFGWGECGADPQTGAALEQLAPEVIGKEPIHVRAIWQQLFETFFPVAWLRRWTHSRTIGDRHGPLGPCWKTSH